MSVPGKSISFKSMTGHIVRHRLGHHVAVSTAVTVV